MSLAAGQTLSFYVILGPLGAGGMGEVYRAKDTRLGREVAIKVLPEDLRGDPERRARFLREAHAVAQLSHPHIAQILDVGEAEGHDFLAFELVEGETLEELAARRRLDVEELVELAAPLADALSYAHEQGVVHRDLKPANVMVTGRGHAKLLDFGLAKVAAAEEGGGASTSLTRDGAVFGTPTAMSPEQALGKPLDPRSDVFSFGSLLYELLGGRPAFQGETVMEVLDAVVHGEPPPLERLRPELPEGLVAIVRKALRKDPRERYQTMSEVSADLRHVRRESQSGVVPRAHASRGGGRMLLAWTGLAAAVLAATWLVLGDGDPGDSAGDPGFVGVMYFDDAVAGPEAEGLGDMLTHLVTTELTRDPSLTVLSQQRLFELARRAGREDGRIDAGVASEVASAAELTTMVVGRVARVGDRLLASASVVDAGSGRELGSGQARGGGIDDVFAMAEDLGSALRFVLRPEPGESLAAGAPPDAAAVPEGRVTSSVEAYREFLAGFRALQLQDFESARERFAAATELDPRFAQAYYWDAITNAWGGHQDRQARSIERAAAFRERLPPDELRALPAAELYHRARLVEARPALESLLARDPDNRDAWYMLGEVYLHSAACADAVRAAQAFERTLEIDPTFSLVHSHLVHAWLIAGDEDRAREWSARFERPNELENWRRAVLCAVWDEDPGWLQGLETPEPAQLGDLAGRFARLLASQLGHAYGGWAETQEWVDGLLADGFAGLRQFSEVGRPEAIAVLNQRLVLAGRFSEAAALFEELPSPASRAGLNNMPASLLAGVRLVDADRVRLTDGDGVALARVLEVTASIEAPRLRWQAVVLALALGRDEVVQEQVEALERLAGQGAARERYYLELVRAELDLAAGRPEAARPVFERALAGDRVLHDAFASAFPPVGRLLDAQLRAIRATGDREAERALLRHIVDRRILRAWDPIVWRRAQLDLAGHELEAGETEPAAERLDDLLSSWGVHAPDLPEVARARALRASVGER